MTSLTPFAVRPSEWTTLMHYSLFSVSPSFLFFFPPVIATVTFVRRNFAQRRQLFVSLPRGSFSSAAHKGRRNSLKILNDKRPRAASSAISARNIPRMTNEPNFEETFGAPGIRRLCPKRSECRSKRDLTGYAHTITRNRVIALSPGIRIFADQKSRSEVRVP